MPSLRTLLETKVRTARGSDVEPAYQELTERGLIYFFNPGTQAFDTVSQCFCWKPPGCGTAVLELWGASGSGGQMCCCGAGVPGNPGAYSRRTIQVFPTSFICGCTGMSCGNSSALCFRGCSQPTGICWSSCTGSVGCMCGQGGRGGYSMCMDGGQGPYCCLMSLGLCGSIPSNTNLSIGASCGTVCNYCANGGNPPDWIARACGGEINCCGGFSCMTFMCCQPSRPCTWVYHIQTSAHVISEDGAVLTFQGEEDTHHSNTSGGGLHQLLHNLNAASRTPSIGNPFSACWSGHRACGCYESQGCIPFLPHGVPGTPASPCSSVRDHAVRGGHGAVRIQYIGTGI
jgi:hypothetical protein